MGQKTIHISDLPQAGNLVKLSGNFLIAPMRHFAGKVD
jgi:hypothetical protein